MLNRSKLWAAILLLAVFAAGAAAGASAWNALDNRNPDSDRRRGGPPGERGGRGYAGYMQQELNLSDEQRVALDSILAENEPVLHEAWSAMRARLDTIRSDVSDKIILILDEEQQQLFQEIIDRSNRRGDRERGSRNHR